ncbi:MAG TPA: hypothetical protein VN778_03580 [Verrucomicrobiae bacterium]|nr:hypothetical protein [Verrucomicrobiae bacterium]
MNPYLYDELRKLSKELGFQSVPDYIRYWVKAAVDGRTFANQALDLTLPEAQAIRFIELLLAVRHVKPSSLERALDDIRQQLIYIKSTQALQKLGLR